MISYFCMWQVIIRSIMITIVVVISVIIGVVTIDWALGEDVHKNDTKKAQIEDFEVPVKLEMYTDFYTNSSVSLASLVSKNYPNFITCLKNSPHGQNFNFNRLKLPEDAEYHYRDLIEKTKIFRDIRVHSHALYIGPWIENYFIHNFIDKPLSYFAGLVPLFIQWTDIHVHDFSPEKLSGNYTGPYVPEWQKMAELLSPLLRVDLIYVTVIQDDEGIKRKLMNMRPNILCLSAGGFGHIAIPLIKGEFSPAPLPPHFTYDVGFYGSHQRAARAHIITQLKLHVEKEGLVMKMGESKHWLQDMLDTKFNLAPRGFGRTSFRLVEIIQLGRLPVYIYDDVPWMPYGDSNISIQAFGFSARGREIQGLCRSIKLVSEDEYKRRLAIVKAVRQEYTYKGVIKQIEKFFRDPFGPNGGNLVCTRVPNMEKRI